MTFNYQTVLRLIDLPRLIFKVKSINSQLNTGQSILYFSGLSAIISVDGGDPCTEANVCTVRCTNTVSIQLSEPVFLTTFGVVDGMVKVPEGNEQLCSFMPTVKFNGVDQNLMYRTITPSNFIQIDTPADTLELELTCSNNEKCEFKVTHINLGQWSKVRHAGKN